jgi:hypothetical protein
MFSTGQAIIEVFDVEHADIKDVRALGGEVIEVPMKPNQIASYHLDELGEHLANYMCSFTGRGYALSRETLTMGEARYVREPGYEAYGLKIFVEGNRIMVGRVAILMDESILRGYLKFLKSLTLVDKPKPKVEIDLPANFGFAPEPPAAEPEKPGS